MKELMLLVLSYVLASIPFGLIVARLAKGIDIRKFGSGNIGATNVFRVVGKGWGILVFILDFTKGLLPPLLIQALLQKPQGYIILLSAILAVVGHNWPIFLKFKGGKGVATTLGAMIALTPTFKGLWLLLLIGLCTWFLVFLLSRYVSLASMAAAVVFTLFSFILNLSHEIKIVSVLFAFFILIRHKKNIKNILSRKEYKF